MQDAARAPLDRLGARVNREANDGERDSRGALEAPRDAPASARAHSRSLAKTLQSVRVRRRQRQSRHEQQQGASHLAPVDNTESRAYREANEPPRSGGDGRTSRTVTAIVWDGTGDGAAADATARALVASSAQRVERIGLAPHEGVAECTRQCTPDRCASYVTLFRRASPEHPPRPPADVAGDTRAAPGADRGAANGARDAHSTAAWARALEQFGRAVRGELRPHACGPLRARTDVSSGNDDDDGGGGGGADHDADDAAYTVDAGANAALPAKDATSPAMLNVFVISGTRSPWHDEDGDSVALAVMLSRKFTRCRRMRRRHAIRVIIVDPQSSARQAQRARAGDAASVGASTSRRARTAAMDWRAIGAAGFGSDGASADVCTDWARALRANQVVRVALDPRQCAAALRRGGGTRAKWHRGGGNADGNEDDGDNADDNRAIEHGACPRGTPSATVAVQGGELRDDLAVLARSTSAIWRGRVTAEAAEGGHTIAIASACDVALLDHAAERVRDGTDADDIAQWQHAFAKRASAYAALESSAGAGRDEYDADAQCFPNPVDGGNTCDDASCGHNDDEDRVDHDGDRDSGGGGGGGGERAPAPNVDASVYSACRLCIIGLPPAMIRVARRRPVSLTLPRSGGVARRHCARNAVRHWRVVPITANNDRASCALLRPVRHLGALSRAALDPSTALGVFSPRIAHPFSLPLLRGKRSRSDEIDGGDNDINEKNKSRQDTDQAADNVGSECVERGGKENGANGVWNDTFQVECDDVQYALRLIRWRERARLVAESRADEASLDAMLPMRIDDDDDDDDVDDDAGSNADCTHRIHDDGGAVATDRDEHNNIDRATRQRKHRRAATEAQCATRDDADWRCASRSGDGAHRQEAGAGDANGARSAAANCGGATPADNHIRAASDVSTASAMAVRASTGKPASPASRPPPPPPRSVAADANGGTASSTARNSAYATNKQIICSAAKCALRRRAISLYASDPRRFKHACRALISATSALLRGIVPSIEAVTIDRALVERAVAANADFVCAEMLQRCN